MSDDDRYPDSGSTRYPTGVLEGLSPDELAEYVAWWDRLRGEAISEADRQEIDEVFGREVA